MEHMRRFAVILVVAVAFVASCSSPAGGPPAGPTPSGCLPAKNPDVSLRWNGVVGVGQNITFYNDAACATTAIEGGLATLLSPAPPVPAPYTSWVAVPLSGPTWINSVQHIAAIDACSALLDDDGTLNMAAFYILGGVTVVVNLPADLWVCTVFD
jgi:hypothetical protein